MKHEWRKKEKQLYIPKTKPEEITVPTFKYYSISGKGNPNEAQFAENTAALYAMSYGIRTMPKNGLTPDGYFEYTVYPLEGIWTLDEKDIRPDGSFSKDDLIYNLMIRQPDFVTEALAQQNIENVSRKKPNLANNNIKFETITDGKCLQIMHLGPYDDETATFAIMKKYIAEHHLKQRTFAHREIYLSDPRKSVPEKMKTVLRYFLE